MTDTKAPDLLPCPFCGGEAVTHERMDENVWDHSQVTWQSVGCGNIDCEAVGFDWPAEAEPSAIQMWNTRADAIDRLTALEAENARLRAALNCDTMPKSTKGN